MSNSENGARTDNAIERSNGTGLSAGEREALLGSDTTSISIDGHGVMWLWGNAVEYDELPAVLSLVDHGLIIPDAPEDDCRTYRVTDTGREARRALRAED